MAQSPLKDTTQPVDSEEEGRSSTMDRQWLIEKELIMPCEYEFNCTVIVVVFVTPILTIIVYVTMPVDSKI